MGWVSTSTSSYLPSGWVADVGPYIGPWPMCSPGVLTDSGGVVNFILALPNPAAPADPVAAFDGTHSTDAFNARRYGSETDMTATHELYFSDRLPSGTPGTVFVAGMHLYVVVNPGGPPVQAPEFYVPASYAVGGVASALTAPGGWSAYQPGPVVEHAAYPLISYAGNHPFAEGVGVIDKASPPAGTDTYPFPPRHLDLAPLYTDAMSGVNGAIADQTCAYGNFSDADTLTLVQLGLTKTDHLNTGGHMSEWKTAIDSAQIQRAWRIRPYLDPIGTDLTFGVDYGPNPDPASYQSFDRTGTEVSASWPDLPGFIGNWDADVRSAEPQGGGADRTVSVAVFVGEHAPPELYTDPFPTTGSHTSPPFWVRTYGADGYTALPDIHSAAVVTGEYIIDFDTGTASYGLLPGQSDPTLALSTLIPDGTPELALYITPLVTSGIHTEEIIAQDMPEAEPAGTLVDTGYGGVFGLTVTLNDAALMTETMPSGSDTGIIGAYVGVPYMAHNPTWRYWRPNRVVPGPVLKTVGENFLAGDGEAYRVRSLVPGYGWVPVQRHG